MPSLTNIWNRIVDWFHDRQDRRDLIQEFNRAAKNAFIMRAVPVILQAQVSRGYKPYKHQFSNSFYSGFRIKAFTGHQLSRQDIINIGETVLADDMLVRRLVILGFDTLEVQCDVGDYGCRWQLRDYLLLGQGG